jgi:hypothetical protein
MKNIFVIIAIIFLLSFSQNVVFAQWDSIPFPNNQGSIDVFTAGNTVFTQTYLVAPFVEFTVFSRSTDNGQTWIIDSTGIGAPVVHAMVSTGDSIWIGATATHISTTNTLDSVLSFGGVFLSTDMGQSWTGCNSFADSDAAFEVTSLAIHNGTLIRGTYTGGTPVSQTGTDSGGGIFVSNDGGSTWSPILTGYTVASLTAINGNLVASFSPYSEMIPFDTTYVSSDEGAHWSKVQGVPDSVYLSLFASDGATLLAAGSWGGLFLSTDNGVHWASSSNAMLDTASINALQSTSAGMFAGTSAGLFFSNDGGLTWSAKNQGLGAIVGIISLAANSNDLFATKYEPGLGGEGGLPGIWRIPISAIAAVDPSEPISGISLQNYPNPFHSSTTIEYALPNSCYATLRVYNALGEQVAILADGMAEPGEHQITFSGTGLPSGMYVFRLSAGSYTQTGVMTLEHSGDWH